MARPEVMTVEQKIKLGYSLKAEGSELYKASDYQGAIKKYHHAILHVKGLDNQHAVMQAMTGVQSNENKDLSKEEQKSIKDLQLMCYNNLAACQLKKKNFEKVIDNCTKAIAFDPDNIKALFRRGTAYYSMKNLCKAEEDFNKILVLNPKEKSVQKYLTEIQTQNIQKEKELYKKMF